MHVTSFASLLDGAKPRPVPTREHVAKHSPHISLLAAGRRQRSFCGDGDNEMKGGDAGIAQQHLIYPLLLILSVSDDGELTSTLHYICDKNIRKLMYAVENPPIIYTFQCMTKHKLSS